MQRLAVEQPVRERRAVVRARGAEREHLVAATREQDRLVPDVPGPHGAIGELRQWESLREIGGVACRVMAFHSLLPPVAPRCVLPPAAGLRGRDGRRQSTAPKCPTATPSA
jgi:hypothetical protein